MVFISGTDHVTDGYRKIDNVSYPCFTSRGGNRIELKEGIWTGSAHADNLKLINIPVFKHHDGSGITGALKHTYGIVSMSDGYSMIRHYRKSGEQCGKMFIDVRTPALNIVDCIWVSHESLCGYPESTTARTNRLFAGIDPVALDYHVSKHVLLPEGGSLAYQHDPDSFQGLIDHLTGALDYINLSGGIGGKPVNQGDDNIDVITSSTPGHPSLDVKANGTDGAVIVQAGTPVFVSVGLIAGGLAGKSADQWVLAKGPAGWWSNVKGTWQPGVHLFSSGVIRDMPPREILNRALPVGDYTFFCAVDDNQSGVPEATWWDTVDVHVRP